MTQPVTDAPATGRAANRLRKRREYIDTAIRIVLNGGLEALTMQALAREMGAAVGTAYTYFASKSALVAELQVLAIGRLTSTYSEAAPNWQAEMGRLDAKGRPRLGSPSSSSSSCGRRRHCAMTSSSSSCCSPTVDARSCPRIRRPCWRLPSLGPR